MTDAGEAIKESACHCRRPDPTHIDETRQADRGDGDVAETQLAHDAEHARVFNLEDAFRCEIGPHYLHHTGEQRTHANSRPVGRPTRSGEASTVLLPRPRAARAWTSPSPSRS